MTVAQRQFLRCHSGRAEGASPVSITTGLACDPRIEINPFRIGPLDQVELPFAAPLFELFLARDRAADVVATFKPDEQVNPISRCEPVGGVRLVLVHATNQIVGHADVECPVFSACEDVNVVLDTSCPGLWSPGSRAKARAPE